MSLKDILVHLDGTETSRHRLELAIALARNHGARLTGLYILDLVPLLNTIMKAEGGTVERFDNYAARHKIATERAARTEILFREHLWREGVEGEWRFAESLPAETVALHARYADLTIVGQIDHEKPPAGNAARVPEEVLLTSGLPVLVIPYAGHFASLGENVLVAWKATRETARALNDALPILERAKKVTVLTINPEQGDDTEPGIPAADITHHLARHGIAAEAANTVADEISTGDALLNYASDCGADLLVMGGYGHSRAREVVFGGVTRQILQQMTIPVLMAH